MCKSSFYVLKLKKNIRCYKINKIVVTNLKKASEFVFRILNRSSIESFGIFFLKFKIAKVPFIKIVLKTVKCFF